MDNSEAVEKLDYAKSTGALFKILFNDETMPEKEWCLDKAQAILAAIQSSPMDFVKVKPLEWYPKPDRWKAEILGIAYVIEPSVGVFDLFCIIDALEEFELGEHSTLKAAQAAAETHRKEMLMKEFE